MYFSNLTAAAGRASLIDKRYMLKNSDLVNIAGYIRNREMYKLLIPVIATLLFGSITFAEEPMKEAKETSTLTIDKAIEKLDAFVNKMTEEDVFSGTVLLARDGKVLYSAARGMASKRFNVPNNLQTKLNLGSMNKMFTATAIMQLVEQKKISLTDKLSQFLDETWIPKDISSKIEIRHLLSHSSGLGSYFTQQFADTSKNRFRALADYKPLIVNDKLQFEPGTGAAYSNTGMFLLGAVIEGVTSQDYFDYIRSNIYEPSGMINSGCYEMDQPIPNLAIGYFPSADNATGWKNNLYLHVLKGGPAGGCFSTVEGLLKFATALTNYKLLSRKNTELLYSPKTELHGGAYGFGFTLGGSPDKRIVGHGGGYYGIGSNLDIFLDANFVSVVLSNYSGGAKTIRTKIRELIKQISSE